MVKNTKALKLVVCMSLIVALAISGLSLSVRAIYENTHYNSGNQASDIVGVAASQVGYGEGGDGYTKYGDWYGLPYSDWCAMFVSWCANQAGVSTDVFPSFALCSAGADWFISQNRFHYAGDYAPQAGDLIFYSSYGNIYHVGLVTGSDSSNVYSIEGNYCEAVYNVSYPLSYGDILGYATPAYSTSAAAVQPENDEDESTAADAVIEETVGVDNYDYEEEEASSDIDVYVDEDDSDDAVVESTNEDIEDTEDTEDTEDSENIPEETAIDESDDEETTDEDKAENDSTEIPAGDVNGDGVVDSADALLIQRYLAGMLTDNDTFSYLNADADFSGEIDVADALFVLETSLAAA